MKNLPLSPSRRSDVRILTVLISVMTAVILVYGMAVRPARSAAAKLRGQDIFTPGSTKIATQEEASIPSVDAQLSSGHSRAVQQSRAMHSFNSPAASYTNSTAITITDCPSPCPASGQAASLYPSPITVVGEVGLIQRVSVTINGLSHTFPSDIDMLLVSPLGRKSVIMSDFGAGAPGVSGINVTLDDYANSPVPSTVTGNTGFPFVSGSYRPSNSGTTDVFPAPAPASPYIYTMSNFNGDSPNGTWNLYIIDDANLDAGSISGGWTITFDVRPPAPTAGQILVSEFRARGVGTSPPASDGSADEFIELYNNTDSSITIIDAIPGADPTLAAGAGWRFGAAEGAAETTFLVLPETLSTAGPLAIPARGHLLITTQPTVPSPAGNTYSLAAYPTGTGFTASGSANISVNPASAAIGFLPDDVGLGVFSTANPLTTNRLDSVGYSSVTNPDYKEGAGLSPAAGITTSAQSSWVRRTSNGLPRDTGDNAADFILVEPSAAVLNGVAAILGAPGPERGPTATAYTTTNAPTHDPTSNMTSTGVDPQQTEGSAPNFVWNGTAVTNGAFGTIKIRRKFTNLTGNALIALRYRIIDLSTQTGGTVPVGQADLRALTSTSEVVTLTDASTVTAQLTTVQTPPTQANGGGVNSSLAENIITTTAPLANGASTTVNFLLGIQTEGSYRFVIIAEADTATPQLKGVSTVFGIKGCAGDPATTCLSLPSAGPASISGRVVADNGRALAGVTMELSGSSSSRAITDSSGNYRFSGVPSGGFYTVSPSLANYSFAPSSRSFSLVADRSEALFTATPNISPTGNPVTGADFFVRQQYLDFLGREPDRQGWLFWTDQLSRCGVDANCIRQKRIDISAAFFQSDEFQQGGNFVYRLYRAGLGRRLSYDEFNADRQQVIGGPELEASRTALADSFVQRAEFVQKYGGVNSGATFVDALLQAARQDAGAELGSQREALLNAYNAGADLNHSRSAALKSVAEASEYKTAVYNSSFVLMEYFGYLRRGPDANGYEFWLDVLNHRHQGNYRGMVCSFLTSAEYQRRFSPIVINSNAECGQ